VGCRGRNDWQRNLPVSIIVACRIRGPRKGVQQHEIGIFVRSTAGLTFRDKYSFLTLYAA
jgi:hypothetical protein